LNPVSIDGSAVLHSGISAAERIGLAFQGLAAFQRCWTISRYEMVICIVQTL
jgi:hypothetical protein